jgi:AraC family transcriptional regulator, regulatory protein of adaptative response / methylated-DNA-[protein]-cysteine methyltransferase
MISTRRRRSLPGEPDIPNEEIRYGTGESVLGPVLVASSDKGVVSIVVARTSDHLIQTLQKRIPRGHLVHDAAGMKRLVAQVVNYIDKPEGILELPLDLRGSPFQRRVWQAISEIPAGSVTSYSEIAYQIGSPRAGRAVGGVCALNGLAFAVPCHRVLHKDGSPTAGNHWSTYSQRALIAREGKDQ